ncbi:Xylan glycosyltransferase MUCI21 [Linum perenne]
MSFVLAANISCDRSSIRTDICTMKGCILTHSPSSSLILYNGSSKIQHEIIRPYTRKWETSIMNTIDELHLILKIPDNNINNYNCDVKHNVPAVIFSTGGYTGNVYHEFNDGLIPLYITSQHFNKQVVFVMLEYHDWWISKYRDVLSQLSNYSALDFNRDNRTHCFPEVIVGLKTHDELAIDPSLSNRTIMDFHDLLDRAYWPRISFLIQVESHKFNNSNSRVPKLAIVSRKGSRAIMNEESLVKLGEKIGFQVEVLRPDRTTELAKIYRALNWSDVMIGVHGAAMTHLLFMRPESVFIQVIPLGLEWASEAYYGEPARKMGLKYIGYRVLPRESSLREKYDENDPVLRDPQSISAKGWNYTKAIYLDAQNVVLDIQRFEKRLLIAYRYIYGKITKDQHNFLH